MPVHGAIVDPRGGRRRWHGAGDGGIGRCAPRYRKSSPRHAAGTTARGDRQRLARLRRRRRHGLLHESRLNPILRSAAPLIRVLPFVALPLLGACGGGAPSSDDFVAVPAAKPGTDRGGCPDLSGTFDVAGIPLAAAIAGRAPPDTHGLPVVMTFRQGPTNIEGWWVVPRQRLVAFATAMSEDTPKRYARWRSLVLKQQLPQNLQQNVEAYLKTVAELGPATPVYALVVGRRCEDNWMLVATSTAQVVGKNGVPRSEETEIWLARDAAGALLVRRNTYTLKHYSIWAPSTQSIRTSRRTVYARVPQTDPESAAPLLPADLPDDPGSRPRTLMACAEVPAHVAAFSDRLNALLLPKIQVTHFRLAPVRQRDADGNCPFAVVDIDLTGADPYFLSRSVDWIRAEPNVDSVEILRDDSDRPRPTTRRLRVVLR